MAFLLRKQSNDANEWVPCTPTQLIISCMNRKEFEINQMNSKIEDEQAIVMQLQKKIKELQVNNGSYLISPFPQICWILYCWIAGCFCTMLLSFKYPAWNRMFVGHPHAICFACVKPLVLSLHIFYLFPYQEKIIPLKSWWNRKIMLLNWGYTLRTPSESILIHWTGWSSNVMRSFKTRRRALVDENRIELGVGAEIMCVCVFSLQHAD